MLTFSIVLLVVMLIVVAVASSKKKKGEMTESSYARIVSALAVLVTVAAVITLVMRLRM
jgi:hypothetical protein